MSRYDRSIEQYSRARNCLAGGVSSNFRYHPIPVPLAIERGEDACTWDADGNRYVDYIIGNGAAFLGHSPTSVLDAVRTSLSCGQAFTSVHHDEIVLAERLVQIIPCAERVRFDTSGTQVDQIALRLARAKTKREKVIKFEGHYHGWADNIFASVAPALNEAGPLSSPQALPQSLGQTENIRDNLIIQPFNEVEILSDTVARHADEIAAIVLEPVACNCGVIPPEPGYLESIRQLCDNHGIVLVFDEVITGFRIALGGAQERYGVVPDLAVYAKAIAGGFPLAAIAGRADIMEQVEDGVVHGGTYNGIVSTIAAGLASLDTLSADDGKVYRDLEVKGARLMDGLRDIGRRHGVPLNIQGLAQIFSTNFTDAPRLKNYRDYKSCDDQMRIKFIQGLQDRGVRVTLRGTWFVPAVLTDDNVDETLDAADGAMRKL